VAASLAGIVGVLAVLLALAFAISLVGGDDSTTSERPLPASVDPGPIHVHGLGVDPADGALFIATHTGTWRVSREETKAERVSGSFQDTMGFTVAGPNFFLGSGHPDLREARKRNLPPLLGLIESRDGGRSWRPISLLGKADFHVLRYQLGRVFGYDATNDRLLVSRDRGKTWRRATRPAPIVDLVAHPREPNRLVASTQSGVYVSADEGRSWKWRAIRTGLLAWPRPKALLLVEENGRVSRSTDVGVRWTRVGTIGGEPAALLARSVRELYVALHDGTIKRSLDGGRTWRVRSRP
jgi:sortilin (neurotensin receptor 3)